MSPAAMRQPTTTHYHFRLQVINAGTPANFAGNAFQTDFNKDVCSAALTAQPFHFHDNLDQFVHVHWAHMTGGLLLKNYGWNFVGGPIDALGFRFDNTPRLVRVAIHGRNLPSLPANAHYYIYTGDATGYQERKWDDFLRQDLVAFFHNEDIRNVSWSRRFIPAASAHNETDASSATEEQLTQLNHVLGNAVIFVQAKPPSDTQIKDRFSHLIPLPESACGG